MSCKPVIVGVLFLAVLGLAAACGGSASTAASSARQATTPTPAGTPELAPAVAMPGGFPADVPIYPGARLTAAASFTGTGQTTWGLNWETPDSIAKVQAFYTTKFSQGDWDLTFSSSTGASFAATFHRKSNSKFGGLLGADGSSGLSRITMSLANAA